MTVKDLVKILSLRQRNLDEYFSTQVLLALKHLLKEASKKDKEIILRLLGAFRDN